MLYNHRIVPGGTREWPGFGRTTALLYDKKDTIPITSKWTAEEAVEILKITKMEGELIGNDYYRIRRAWEKETYDGVSMAGITGKTISFPEYLSDLLSLVPLKGLTIEEIKRLNANNT